MAHHIFKPSLLTIALSLSSTVFAADEGQQNFQSDSIIVSNKQIIKIDNQNITAYETNNNITKIAIDNSTLSLQGTGKESQVTAINNNDGITTLSNVTAKLNSEYTATAFQLSETDGKLDINKSAITVTAPEATGIIPAGGEFSLKDSTLTIDGNNAFASSQQKMPHSHNQVTLENNTINVKGKSTAVGWEFISSELKTDNNNMTVIGEPDVNSPIQAPTSAYQLFSTNADLQNDTINITGQVVNAVLSAGHQEGIPQTANYIRTNNLHINAVGTPLTTNATDISDFVLLPGSPTTRAYHLSDLNTADIRNNTISIKGDKSAGFWLDTVKTFQSNNITMDVSGNLAHAYLINDSDNTTINNNNITVNGTNVDTLNNYIIGVRNSNVNIKNSKINDKGNSIAFTNIHDISMAYLYDSSDGSQPISDKPTTINISNSQITGNRALIALNGITGSELMVDPTLPTTGNQQPFTVNSDHSELTGIVTQYKPESKIDLTLNLTNHSQWNMTDNSAVTHLKNEDSDVIFSNNPNFSTLTIDKDLTGHGRFTLNTDLATERADLIVVKGQDSGDHTLIIRNSDTEPTAPNGKVTLVKTQTGKAVFHLADKDYVDAGAYRYRLGKDGNNWILSNKTNEPAVTPKKPETAKPVEPIVTPEQPETAKPIEPIVTPAQPETAKPVEPIVTPEKQNEQVMLSEKTNGLISMRQAERLHVEAGLPRLHQRLGEHPSQNSVNVWARNINTRTDFDPTKTSYNSQSSGFKQTLNTLQVGVDKALNENVRLGGFVGTGHSKVDFNGDYKQGKINSKSIGLYATFTAQNGIYFDTIAKYDYLKLTNDGFNGNHNHAYTLSGELGKVIKFGQSQQWTFTPQGQVALTHITGSRETEKSTSVHTRLGLRLAHTTQWDNGWSFQPYAEINGLYSANNSGIKVNNHYFTAKNSASRIEGTLGTQFVYSNHRIGLQASTTSGHYMKHPISAQAVYRFTF